MPDRSVVLRDRLDAAAPVRQRLRLFGQGWLGYSYYKRESSESSFDPGAAGRAELDFGPLTFVGGGGGFRARQLYSIDIEAVRHLRSAVGGRL